MSRRLLNELRDCLEGAVLTALTGFGRSLLLLTALFGQADMARVAAVCAVAALATCVLAVLPVRIIVPLLIAGIALLVIAIGLIVAGVFMLLAFVVYMTAYIRLLIELKREQKEQRS